MLVWGEREASIATHMTLRRDCLFLSLALSFCVSRNARKETPLFFWAASIFHSFPLPPPPPPPPPTHFTTLTSHVLRTLLAKEPFDTLQPTHSSLLVPLFALQTYLEKQHASTRQKNTKRHLLFYLTAHNWQCFLIVSSHHPLA